MDHGKTTLLDTFLHTSYQKQEFGGTTQIIRANDMQIPYKTATGETAYHPCTFLDTPGQSCFSFVLFFTFKWTIDSRKWKHSLGSSTLRCVSVRRTFGRGANDLSSDEREQNARDRGVYEEWFGLRWAERISEAVHSRIGCLFSSSHLFVSI